MFPDIQMRSLNSFAGLVVHRLLQDSSLNIYEIGVRKENRCAIMKPQQLSIPVRNNRNFVSYFQVFETPKNSEILIIHYNYTNNGRSIFQASK